MVGVSSDVETSSSTPWPTMVWNAGLPRIMSEGAVGLPISPVLLRVSSSMPPKQKLSAQTAADVCQLMRKSHPVPFCLAAKVTPEAVSVMVWVSVHCEGWYALLTLTAIVDLYAVTVAGAADAVPMERVEARMIRTIRPARMPQNFLVITLLSPFQ